MRRRDFLAASLAFFSTAAFGRLGIPSAAWSPLLADLHRRTFKFFWETTPAATGLAPDRWPSKPFSSVAAIGFALTAYCIGVHSGYVSRAHAAERTLTTLRTLWNGRQSDGRTGAAGYKGFFYHFLSLQDGLRYRHCELSNVDTTMLLLGALTASAFFNDGSQAEAEIRHLARALYERVEWRFFERESGVLSMGWDPETGFNRTTWSGYNEGMMIYLLAIASPRHPLPPKSWQAWCSTYDRTWGPNFGTPHLGFAPLMGHQYTEIWYDMRGIADDYMRRRKSDYFRNSQLATIAQRNYAIQNPHRFNGYGADVWGLSPCDGPADVRLHLNGRNIAFHSYAARGPSVTMVDAIDDGTISPSAAISSIAFAPDICISAAEAMFAKYGGDIYGPYGFYDSFNLTFPAASQYGRQTKRAGWVANDYIGIDQGPILAMLENYRSGFVWNLLRQDPYVGAIIKRGLRLTGFKPVAPQGAWLEAGAG